MTRYEAEGILNLKGTYDEATLDRAYRKKAKEVHGDITGSDEAMIKVNLAYEFLKKGWNKNDYSSFNNTNFYQKRREYLEKLTNIISGCEFLKKNHADYFKVAYETISGLIESFKILSGTLADDMDKYYMTTMNGIKAALKNLANSFIQSNGLDPINFRLLNYDRTLKNFYGQLLEVIVNKNYEIGKIGLLKEKLKKAKGYDNAYSKVLDVVIEEMLLKAIKLGYVGTSKESIIIEEYKSLYDNAFCRYLEGQLWNTIKNSYKTEAEVKSVIEVWLIYFKNSGCNSKLIEEILELAGKTKFENVFNNLVDEYSRILKTSNCKDLDGLKIRIKKIHELMELLIIINNDEEAKKDVYLQCAIRKINLNDLESIENAIAEIKKIVNNNKSGIYVLNLNKSGYYHGKMISFNLFMLKNDDDSLKMCSFPSFIRGYLQSDYFETIDVSSEDIAKDFIPLEDFLEDAWFSYGGNSLICEKVYGEFVVHIILIRNGEIAISKNYKHTVQKKGEKLVGKDKQAVVETIKLILETKYQRYVKKAKK